MNLTLLSETEKEAIFEVSTDSGERAGELKITNPEIIKVLKECQEKGFKPKLSLQDDEDDEEGGDYDG